MSIRVLENGRIFTGVKSHPWATALAGAGGRIVALDEAALAWKDAPGSVAENLGGATVLPGLVDAHIHLLWYALSLQEIPLRDLSRAALLRSVADKAHSVEPGTWILGRGWDNNIWSDTRFTTAAEIDAWVPDHPVLLIAKSAHAAVANSLALRLAGITGDAEDPPRGRLGRDVHGAPNGMLFEHAIKIVQAAAPSPTLAEAIAALQIVQRRLLAAGITGVHDMDGGVAFAAFQALHAEDRLALRVVKYLRIDSFDALLQTGLRSGFGDARLRFGGLKLYVDGALGSRTGALLEPYVGEPDNTGLLTLDREHLAVIARQAASNGIAMAIHAIGDRANRVVIDVLEEVAPLNPALRHRIEHVQLVTPDDSARLGRLGVVASMQPIHAPHDRAMAERYWGARTRYAYAWRMVKEAGATLAFGSDAPIEVFDPWAGLYAAVTRRHERDGSPGPQGWHPEQCLALEEAIIAYTWGSAYAAGLESHLGRLWPGYIADLIVLNENVLAVPPEALLQTCVQRVMVAGNWVDLT
ncbi:MAG: amidohydrolase [Anaerolineae bacterium]|nr:amidohydrolase [Anaerolineae bacterium]